MRILIAGSLVFLLNFSWAQTGPGGVGNAANNVLWLSADAGVTPATNGSDVVQWSDRSGNGRHASHGTAGERPNYQTNILNSHPVIRFTAANNDRLLSTNVATGNAASVFAVARWMGTLTTPNPGIIQASPAGQAFSSTNSGKTIGLWVSSTSPNQVWGRGVESGGTSRDIPFVTNTAVNTFYTFLNLYNGTNNITQYVNNTTAGSVAYNGTLAGWSDFGIGRQAGESWNGDIAEVIAYNISVNSAQRIIINNYLAAKYGLTLSSDDVYTMDNSGSGNFDFEVAGIGRVNSTNIHDNAQGSGILRVFNPTDLEDGEFFIWGHNDGALQATVLTGLPAGVDARFARLWRVSETGGDGNVGAIDMEFDVTGLPDFAGMSECDVGMALRLLVDTDNDNSFADETPIYGAINVGSNRFQFRDVSAIQNGERFTLAIYNTPANNGPGGVSNMAMWWRADVGLTASSGLISAWADQSGNGRDLASTGTFRPTLATSADMNDQPVVRYSGAQYFTSSFNGPGTDNLTLLLVARGTSYQSLFRFQNSSGTFVVYPWELGTGSPFISSSDGGTGGGVATGLQNNQNNVGVARYQRNVTGGMRAYRNGTLVASRNAVNSPLPSEPFFSGRYNPGASEYPNCDVGELVGYYYSLNEAQMIIVQNYLAAKYNVGLAAAIDRYLQDNTGNGDFDFDVAGIGRVDGSNIHNDSRGTGWVRIFNPSNLDNNEFLIWGHNNGPITVNTTDIPSGVQARLNRVWRVSERNATSDVNVGNVNIQFDLSQLHQPITASDLRLLIDHDGDGIFNEAGTIAISGAVALSCDNYLFNNVPGANLTDGDRFTIATINSTQTPLPVSLISFTGAMAEGDAHLRWATASETNNDYFTIERSANGTNFYPIGRVDGSGTTLMQQDYTFVDAFAPYGKIYYRLKQTDFDGEYTYSNVIVLDNKPDGLKLIAVPNPSSAGQQIRLRVTHTEQVDARQSHIAVSDVTGRAVAVTVATDEAGDILLTFPPSQASGVYIVTLRSSQLQRSLFARVQIN